MAALETVFRIANFGAVIAWIILAASAAFGWRRPLAGFCGVWVPALLAAAYAALLIAHWRAPGDFMSLGGIGTLFRQPAVLLAGWLHYLAFDLLVGVAIVRRAQDDGIPRLLLLPVLPLAFLFGPAGWLLFQAICFARRGNAAPAATAGRPGPVRRPKSAG